MRYFEDFEPGQVYELGTYEMTRDEIVDFARRYDPQPFHLDEEAATGSIFGGLVASGWHTLSAFMRIYVDGLLRDTASLASPGLDEVRWRRPVRPGDVLQGRVTVLETEPSARHPERGTVRFRSEGLNQHGDVVVSFSGRSLFGRRPAG